MERRVERPTTSLCKTPKRSLNSYTDIFFLFANTDTDVLGAFFFFHEKMFDELNLGHVSLKFKKPFSCCLLQSESSFAVRRSGVFNNVQPVKAVS